jgi:hypothetical protein
MIEEFFCEECRHSFFRQFGDTRKNCPNCGGIKTLTAYDLSLKSKKNEDRKEFALELMSILDNFPKGLGLCELEERIREEIEGVNYV